jgi:hypothetical protein
VPAPAPATPARPKKLLYSTRRKLSPGEIKQLPRE